MRPIDADALKENIFSKSDSMEDLWDTAGILNLINNTPTVKRPQGEWIIDAMVGVSFFRKCSNCNEAAEWLDGGSQFLSKFCPNCGAQMKGGVK